jgi:hypothetical protein
MVTRNYGCLISAFVAARRAGLALTTITIIPAFHPQSVRVAAPMGSCAAARLLSGMFVGACCYDAGHIYVYAFTCAAYLVRGLLPRRGVVWLWRC